MKITELKQLAKKHPKKLLLAIGFLLVIVLTVSYSFIAPRFGGPSITDIFLGSNTVDKLTFIPGSPLKIEATIDNFAEGADNLTSESISSVNLIANDHTSTATENYNVYFSVESNNYEYSTEERLPEIILEVFDPEGNIVNWNTDLDFVSVTDSKTGLEISGYDITTFEGLVKFADNHEISSTNVTDGVTQSWEMKVTYINLPVNQASNLNREITSEILLTQENLESTTDIAIELMSDFNPNVHGWTNQDVNYNITVFDPSEIGISQKQYCVDDRICGPRTNLDDGILTVTNSGETVVCASATDVNGASTLDCSTKVKIDKEEPVPGEIVVTGDLGNYGWYTSEVTVSATDGIDAISGHDTTIVNIPSIVSSTEGTLITATTMDKAGNIASSSLMVKVDLEAPVISGVENKVLTQNESVDLLRDVSCYDAVSSKDYCEVTVTPNVIDTSSPGEQFVTYKASDRAGHETVTTVTYTVVNDQPIISLSPDTSLINQNGWAKTDVPVEVKITDPLDSAINNKRYCIDDKVCSPSTSFTEDTITVTENGDNILCVFASNANNATSTTCTNIIKVDKTLPVPGNINLSGTVGTNGFYRSAVSITTSGSTDTVSGVSASLSHNIITSDTSGTTVTLTVTDEAGNTASKTTTVKKDATGPSAATYTITRDSLTGTTVTNTSAWRNYNIYIKDFNSSDSTSGIARYEYSSRCTGTVTDNLDSNYSYENESDTYYCVRAIDNAGNPSSWSTPIYVKIDKTAPTVGTINLNGTLGYSDWYRSTVSITRSGYSDSLSGVKTSSLSHTSIAYDTSGTTVTLTTTDNAGNKSTTTKVVKRDTVKPTVGTINVSGTLGTNSWYRSNVSLSRSGYSDDRSGVRTSSLNRTSITFDTKGTTVTLTTTDNAGNTSSTSKVIKRDTVAPSAPTVSMSAGGSYTGTYWTYNNVSVSLSSSDATSGISYYRRNGGSIASSHTYTNNYLSAGYNYSAVDAAGNVSGNSYRTIYISKYFDDYLMNSQSSTSASTGLIRHTSSVAYSAKDNNYRYSGAQGSNNNYVWFNNAYWQILGVYFVDGEYKVKIIKDVGIYGVKFGSWEYNTSNIKTTLNNYYNSMAATSKNMVQYSTFEIGNIVSDDNKKPYNFTLYEDDLTTKQYVGLMTPSDYLFAAHRSYWNYYNFNPLYANYDYDDNESIKTNNWMYKDYDYEYTANTLWNDSELGTHLWRISKEVRVGTTNWHSYDVFHHRPTLYLKSSVRITGGNGSFANPYIIAL